MKVNSNRSDSACFHSLDDGRTIFVPAGELGSRAYLIESVETEERLRGTMRRLDSLFLPLIFAVTSALSLGFFVLVGHFSLPFLLSAFVLAAPLWGAYRVFEWRVTAGLERIPLPDSLEFPSTASLRRALGWVILLFSGLALFFLLISIPMLDYEGVAIGGLLSVLSVWLWKKFRAMPAEE